MLTNFAKFLLTTDPQNNPSALATYNYIKYFENYEANLDTDFFQRMKQRLFSFNYWQQEKKQLYKFWLETLKAYDSQSPLDQSPEKLIGQHWQIINLYNSKDLFDCLKRNVTQNTNQRILVKDKFVAAVQRQENEELLVSRFGTGFYIENGQLVQLSPNTQLHYTVDLNLSYAKSQLLSLSNNSFARFKVSTKSYSGLILRGYCLQKHRSFQIEKLEEYSDLFYAKKRFESHFIDKTTDPFYLEVSDLIEKSIELLQNRSPEARSTGYKALKKGQEALDHIFQDDKLLRLLLKELSNQLHQNQVGTELWQGPKKTDPLDLTNLLPIVE